jgi:hypothetical protein
MNPEARLFPRLKYGGNCVVCGDEVPEDFPGWVMGRSVACATHHIDDVVSAVNDGPEMRTEAPKPNAVASVNDIAIVEALERQSRALEAMTMELRKIVDVGIKVTVKQ